MTAPVLTYGDEAVAIDSPAAAVRALGMIAAILSHALADREEPELPLPPPPGESPLPAPPVDYAGTLGEWAAQHGIAYGDLGWPAVPLDPLAYWGGTCWVGAP